MVEGAQIKMRVRLVKITGDVLMKMFVTGNPIKILVKEGMPDDAKVLDVRFDHDTVALLVESAEFDEIVVDAGTDYPVHPAIVLEDIDNAEQ